MPPLALSGRPMRAAFMATLLVGVTLVGSMSFPIGSRAEGDETWYPSRYGPEDTIGAANNLSPEGVKKAAGLVTTGKTYALGITTGRETPAYPPRRFDMTILQLDDGTGTPQGDNRLTGNDDILHSWLGIGTQIDGLGHIGIGHLYYNGTPSSAFVAPTGLTKFGTDTIPPIVTRGVLLDMTQVFGIDLVPEGTAFNTAEITDALTRQGVEIGQGDVVLFHTGWGDLIDKDPERFSAAEPGLGVGGAAYLASLGVVAIGADTWAVEVIPFEQEGQVFPVHQTLLAKNGVYILENIKTRELAADGVSEFLFVLGQPLFEGAVQMVINPIAIR